MQAHAVAEAIDLVHVYQSDHLKILAVNCDGYEAWRALPRVVSFEGEYFALTGRNSDHDEAYYRNDRPVAFSA